MPLRILIVNPDEREQIILRYLLEQIKGVEILASLMHGLEALMFCQEKKVDLIFMDIPAAPGEEMELIAKIRNLKQAPLLVMISAEKEVAAAAYDQGALDFILKPIERSRIETSIQRAQNQLVHREYIEEMVRERLKERIDLMLQQYQNYEQSSQRLPVREKGKISLLNSGEIIYCESQGKKVYICTIKKGYNSNYTLNELETRLDKSVFFRAHQAFIVNLNYVKEIVNFGEGSYILHLDACDKNIILSRSRAKNLRQKLGLQ